MRKFLKRGALTLLIFGALWAGLTYWANGVHAQSAGCPNPNPNLSAWTTLTGPFFQGLDTAPSVNCPLPAGTATTGLNGALNTIASTITGINASIASINTSITNINNNTCLNIMNNGGDKTGVNDNTAAFNTTVTNGGTRPCVYFPAGLYKFTSAPTVNLPGTSQGDITIKGDGVDSTEIRPSSNGFVLGLNGTYQSFHVQNLAITTASACAGCTALNVTQNAVNSNPANSGQSDITNVAIYGVDRSSAFPSGVDYFQTGVALNSVSNVSVANLRIDGVQSSSGPAPGVSRGIWLTGTAATIGVVYNFVNTTVNLYSRGLDIGSYIQGINWSNGNLTGDMVGMYVSSATGVGDAQLFITNSQFNDCDSVYVPGPAPGSITLAYLDITNTAFLTAGQPWSCGAFLTSLDLNNGVSYAAVHNNIFSGNTAYTAVHAAGVSYSAGKIANNMINGFGIGVDTTNAGVTVSGLLVNSNTITNSTTGIKLGATTIDAVISNNIMEGNGTDLVNNAALVHNYIDIPQDCHAYSTVGFVIGGVQTGITYSSATCYYSVVSRQAFMDIDYTFSSLGGLSGNLTFQDPGISNPNSPGGNCTIGFLGAFSGLAFPITGSINANSSIVNFFQMGATGSTPAVTASVMTNNTRIQARCTWRTVTFE